MEKYDAQGVWREVDVNGHPIVSELSLLGTTVRDPFELAAAIGGSQEFPSCVATKLLTYALNRGTTTEENCLARELALGNDGTPPSFETMAIEALLQSFKLTSTTP